jgi:hypothetical protein
MKRCGYTAVRQIESRRSGGAPIVNGVHQMEHCVRAASLSKLTSEPMKRVGAVVASRASTAKQPCVDEGSSFNHTNTRALANRAAAYY